MKKIIRLIKLNPGVWAVPIILAKFFLTALILQWIDPTAATFDIGILQTVSLVIVSIICFNDVVFLGIRLNFPNIYKHYKEIFFGFTTLTPFQKTCALLSIYLVLMLCCCLLAAAYA